MQIKPGHIAVVTGGGSRMGREICLGLARKGCHVATCDVNQGPLDETLAECRKVAQNGSQQFSGEICDVRDEEACHGFAKAVAATLKTKHINLLFNNAGIGGEGSLFGPRANYDFVVDVCWKGVYHMTRAFLDLLVASSEGALVNTSSISGFHVNAGVAYSTAKFAVKGFSEGLIADFRKNAPHLNVHCVMPGFIVTNIGLNTVAKSYEVRTGSAAKPEQVDRWNKKIAPMMEKGIGLPAPDAAMVILNGVEDGKWAILVGDDAEAIDKGVRAAELGDIYPLEDFVEVSEKKAPPDNSNWLARKGDPTWFPGRQTQIARREAARASKL